MSALVHMIPRWPADEPNGVRDYARVLQQALSRHQRWDGGFVALSGTATVDEAAPVSVAASARPEALWVALGEAVSRLRPKALLLHYAGYGYARRGAPLWLPSLLRRAKRDYGLRILTMFHELYATGLPWQSAFWFSFLQRQTVAAVARESDFCMTNRKAYARWLDRHRPAVSQPTTHLPVFSNVGEPANRVPWDRREPTLVIWSGATHKREFYRQHSQSLSEFCERLALRQVVDVGARAGIAPVLSADLSFREAGLLPAEAVSRLLGSSRCGLLLGYPSTYLAKSGIYAAYRAHGLVTFLLQVSPVVEDELILGEDFFNFGQITDERRLTKASADAQDRYAICHSVAHAARVAAFLHEARS